MSTDFTHSTDLSPGEILHNGADTYEEKNEDYGNSWYIVGEIMYLMAGEEPITLETPEDFVRIGLFTRRLDKLVRAFNGEFCTDEMTYESIFDSHTDEAVYAAMAASIAEMD
jgi:hypothetical protein